jgi:hypothetical protein
MGESHDRTPGENAGRGNKLALGDGPAMDWTLLLLCLFIYSLGVWGFVIHPASSRGNKPQRFQGNLDATGASGDDSGMRDRSSCFCKAW